ncbi:general secretion pathway protein C [gamma proteobacterium HTCC5015]|nr:general secretion pathway protein C [gamma proteobacterium HTCC5015]
MSEEALQKLTAHPLWQRFVRVAPSLCTALLLALLAWWSASAVWALVPVASGPDLPLQKTVQSHQPAAVRYGAQVANKHLFGRADVQQASGEIENAPETRLDLVLRGVLAIEPQESALALISRGTAGLQEVYGIGDTLPGNAELVEVHSDRVIIQYQGRYETLTLQDAPELNIASKDEPQSQFLPGNASRKQAIAPSRAASLRDKFLKSPSSLMELVTIKPKQENGELVGYQVNPKGDPALFYQTGLRDGDVIVSVNSVPVNKPRKINKLRNADQYDVVVLRNGSKQLLSISFK